MHFDDRLATVLRHRATGERAARTQFRQLLDLLGSRTGPRDQNLLAAAWLRLGALGEMLPAADRAAMIRDPGLRFRNPELAAHLAEDEPGVAVAALARAELSDDDWEALIPRLPIRARGFLRLRRDIPANAVRVLDRLGIHDRGLPLPDRAEGEAEHIPPAPQPEAANDAGGPLPEDSEIGALVKRIESFRLARQSSPALNDAPRLPLDDRPDGEVRPALAAIDFTADAEGRIDWADLQVAPMLVGMRLADNSACAALFQRHQPLRNCLLTLEGAPPIAGDWIMDAAPRFTRPGGRFYGYAGKFRRPAPSAGSIRAADTDSEGDRIRQLLHELRTPVNAIQGFAEIIQQQLFGPTPHEYRAMAANIAGDSARILAGFDELDRLARLETGAIELEHGVADFRATVDRIAVQLQDVLKSRTAGFEVQLDPQECLIGLAPTECEIIVWRLLATIASAVGAGETVQLILEQDGAMARLCCDLPASLSDSGDIFSASARPVSGAVSAGMFGAGFSLRLARAEARGAGGNLVLVEDWLMLSIPLLTGADTNSSDRATVNRDAQPGGV